jgi:hypothetical protein
MSLQKFIPTPIFRFICFIFFLAVGYQAYGQGYWTSLSYEAPDPNGGVMVLLSDGRVMCKTFTGADEYGDTWNILTPDYDGTYAGGTWTTATPMHRTRLYCSSRLLQDGRLYVAGGEYGTGAGNAEVYNPLTDTWTMTANPPIGTYFYDANSELLPDGRVLQAVVYSTIYGYTGNYIYDPATNSYTVTDQCINSADESSWVLLPDSSILFVDIGSTTSERYIPELEQWVVDDTLPELIYDAFQSEVGPGFLLPDGRAWFVGGTHKTAYYTPSGSIAPGSWASGPDIPLNLGSTDGAGAMMPDGKILIALAPEDQDTANTYLSPTHFYEFNYLTNTFTPRLAPDGNPTLNIASYVTNMLVLPDGNILYATLGDIQYYLYHPAGAQLAAGKPTVSTVTGVSCDVYTITGTLFNGISEGAAFGDDWQMATNYPIIRLTQGGNAWYARSYDWNRTGVAYGGLPDTATFEVPANLPAGSFSLEVIVNGIHSNAFPFTPCNDASIENAAADFNARLFPNPANENCYLQFELENNTGYTVIITDLGGRQLKSFNGISSKGITQLPLEIENISAGMYHIILQTQSGSQTLKLVVQ